MSELLPPNLLAERAALIAEIHEAFRGVKRLGGVSWSEAQALDDYEGPAECAAARASDRETAWEDLLDDPKWHHQAYGGGFTFLDSIGFRYYIAPAMIRVLRGEDEGFVPYALTYDVMHESEGKEALVHDGRENWQRIDARQRLCIARFLQHMRTIDHLDDPDFGYSDWGRALDQYWGRFLPSGPV